MSMLAATTLTTMVTTRHAHAQMPSDPPSAATSTSATTAASATTPAAVPDTPYHAPLYPPWGDGDVSLDERFSNFHSSTRERGDSGPIRGAGVEARVMIPYGWGAYYRWTTWTQTTKTTDPYRIGEFAIGMSKRLHETGSTTSFFRTSSRFSGGFLYGSVDSNETCSPSYAPFTASCATQSYFGRLSNASGTSLGLEMTLDAELAIARYLVIGVGVGAEGYARVTTGGESVSPPRWIFLPTATLRIGLVLPWAY